jgi:hypothetical protein
MMNMALLHSILYSLNLQDTMPGELLLLDCTCVASCNTVGRHATHAAHRKHGDECGVGLHVAESKTEIDLPSSPFNMTELKIDKTILDGENQCFTQCLLKSRCVCLLSGSVDDLASSLKNLSVSEGKVVKFEVHSSPEPTIEN